MSSAEADAEHDALDGHEAGLDQERPAHHRRREAHGPQHADLPAPLADRPHHDHAEPGDADEQPEPEVALHAGGRSPASAVMSSRTRRGRSGVGAVGHRAPCSRSATPRRRRPGRRRRNAVLHGPVAEQARRRRPAEQERRCHTQSSSMSPATVYVRRSPVAASMALTGRRPRGPTVRAGPRPPERFGDDGQVGVAGHGLEHGPVVGVAVEPLGQLGRAGGQPAARRSR